MFDSRSSEQELLDQPDCDPALAIASYRFMAMINRYFGGVRTVRHFLEKEIAERHPDTPLRILDIGSGACDIPLAISRWARANNIPLQFTCLEMADHAADIARDKITRAGDPTVKVLQENVFTYQPDEPYDYAIASMCFHHFTDEQILALLHHLHGFVLNSVLINDLQRSRFASIVVKPLLLGTHAGVRNDALLSIRRGFKRQELNTLLSQLEHVTVSVKSALWFRIAAIIRFTTGEKS